MNARFLDNELLRRALIEMASELKNGGDDHAPFPLVRRALPTHDYEVDMGEKVLTRKTGQRWMVWRKT